MVKQILIASQVLCCRMCGTILIEGYCKRCRFSPSIQDIKFILICPNCRVEIKRKDQEHECPKCKAIIRVD